MAEHVAQPYDLRCLDHLLGKVSRNEYYSAVSPQYHIAWHYRSHTDSRRCIDANERSVERTIRIVQVMGGMVRAIQGSERPDLLRSEEHTSELQSRENLVC